MGLFIYYVSMNNQWSFFKKMTKHDREGLRVIRKDDVKSVPRLPNGTVFGYTLDRTAAAAGSLPSLVR